MNPNQLKAGVALSYISIALGYIITLLYTPVMLSILGQSEYGLYTLSASIVGYLGLLSFGFGGSYIRYYYIYKVNNANDNIAKLNGMFLLIFSVIAVISLLSGIVLVLNVSLIFGNEFTANELSTSRILMSIMVFNISISFPCVIFNAYVTANEKYFFQKILRIIQSVLSPFLMFPVLLMGYRSVGIALVTTIITIFIELTNISYCFRKLKIKFSFKRFDFALMKDIATFSFYIFINAIIDQLTWNVDKFIIGRIKGTASVAVYSLASQINMQYLSLSTVISGVFIPTVNKIVAKSGNNDELLNLFTRIGRIQFIVLSLICSGFIFFGKPFVSLWVGSDYINAYYITLLLIIPVTIPLVQNLGIEIQKAKNMHKFRSWLYLFVAIGNICLSIPLTNIFGATGAAFGTAIALLIGSGVFMNWYYHNKLYLNMKYFWIQILKFIPSLLFPISLGILFNIFINLYHIIPFLICGFSYVLIFFVSMWYCGMNKSERDLISRSVMNVLKY